MVKQTTSAIAPLLVIAVGNPSRGDDALGPALIERLQAIVESGAKHDEIEVELLTDFQLQVEHALDLVGRRAVLFVDAALPGVVNETTIESILPDEAVPPASHALRPGAVLNVAMRVNGHAPPAWLLAIEGRDFELGEGLSEIARMHLDRAVTLAGQWLQARSTRQDQLLKTARNRPEPPETARNRRSDEYDVTTRT